MDDSLEVALEILGSSPLGDEAACGLAWRSRDLARAKQWFFVLVCLGCFKKRLLSEYALEILLSRLQDSTYPHVV